MYTAQPSPKSLVIISAKVPSSGVSIDQLFIFASQSGFQMVDKHHERDLWSMNNSIHLYSYNSTIHVECSEELINSQFEVFDITGRKVLSSTIVSTNEQLNLSSKTNYSLELDF